MGGITVLCQNCLAILWLMMAWTLQELRHYETCYWPSSAQAIGFGYYTDLLWWNDANWPVDFGFTPIYKCEGSHTYWCQKYNWGMQSKMVFKICEGISCSSIYVKEFDVNVHKKYFPYVTILNFWLLCTPNHSRTWWLTWELCIVTVSYFHVFPCMKNRWSCKEL